MNLRVRSLQVFWVFAAIVFSICARADAHFVWVYSEDGKVKVVFGEGLEPDQAQFLGGLGNMKAFTYHDGKYKAVELQKQVDGDEGWFEVSQKKLGQSLEISCPYGVFGRGDKTMFLDYSARYLSCSPSETNVASGIPSKNLALDLVPKFVDGQLSLTAFFQGKPVKGVEVQLEYVDIDSSMAAQLTGETGMVNLQPSTRYVVRAKYSLPESGEIDGQKFSERRFYCTLVLDVNSSSADKKLSQGQAIPQSSEDGKTKDFTVKQVDSKFEDFPKGMTSFGATVIDNCIYVIGGKSGRAHSYAKSYQNRNVYQLKLDGSSNGWQVAGENLGLQGLAIVGHAGRVYRIGGLEARNEEGETHDLHSVSDFLSFDPSSREWVELPSLPEGRSSFDACLSDNQIYVVGGWEMAGENESRWATDMLKFDLSHPEKEWVRIESPFKTRALSVRPHQGKLVVIGGIEQKGGPTNSVHIFDLKKSQWSLGPEVPTSDGLKAFGCSSVPVGDDLLVSTYDGGIFRLGKDCSDWEKVYQLDEGRFFHQMLSIGESRFALIGGSHMEHGSQMEVAVFEIGHSDTKSAAQ